MWMVPIGIDARKAARLLKKFRFEMILTPHKGKNLVAGTLSGWGQDAKETEPQTNWHTWRLFDFGKITDANQIDATTYRVQIEGSDVRFVLTYGVKIVQYMSRLQFYEDSEEVEEILIEGSQE
jgi:hypothetical protein